MRSKPRLLVLAAAAAVAFGIGHARAQEPPASQEPRIGPYSVPRHWSKYDYPESIPDGVFFHIIVRGDTLWDLSRRYLKSPLLWPQIWNDNKYITDAHWIYPGDPLVLKSIDIVASTAGQKPALPAAEVEIEREATQTGTGTAVVEELSPLYPATEIVTMQCAPQLVEAKEDESLYIVGSEMGPALHISYADRDILYLSKGANAGIRPGDLMSVHARKQRLKHPVTHKNLAYKVLTKGWVRVIAVQETSATAVVEQACLEIMDGEYLKPFEKVSVPVLVRQDPPDRLTPPSGKAQGYVVDVGEDLVAGAAGHLVWVDIGSSSGVAPGNLMTVYRIEYPKLPSSRHVAGELAVLAVRDRLALAKINYSTTFILAGDSVELR